MAGTMYWYIAAIEGSIKSMMEILGNGETDKGGKGSIVGKKPGIGVM